MNSIPVDQVKEYQLDRLAAQRQLYSQAKSIQALQMCLVVFGGATWSLTSIAKPDLKGYAGLYGMVVVFMDLFFMVPRQKALKQQAATIQELFDCDVLQLPWRELKTGRRPDAEAIMAASDKFKCKDADCSTLRNWYPVVVGELPIHVARLVCQRCGCRWDAELRRQYGDRTLCLAILLIVGLLLYGVARHLAFDTLIIGVITPLLPVLWWGIREYQENMATATSMERLKAQAEKVWDKAVNGSTTSEELTKDARDIQDEVYEIRKKSSLVYDWFYRRLRGSQERQMVAGAEQYVREVQGQMALNSVVPPQDSVR